MIQIQLVVCIPIAMEQIRAESIKAQFKNGFPNLRLTWKILSKYGCIFFYTFRCLHFLFFPYFYLKFITCNLLLLKNGAHIMNFLSWQKLPLKNLEADPSLL